MYHNCRFPRGGNARQVMATVFLLASVFLLNGSARASGDHGVPGANRRLGEAWAEAQDRKGVDFGSRGFIWDPEPCHFPGAGAAEQDQEGLKTTDFHPESAWVGEILRAIYPLNVVWFCLN